MLNSDLIAHLQPAPNLYNAHEWRDACGHGQDVFVDGVRLVIRLQLTPGIYKGRIETLSGAFDMNTAMVEMTRVPDLTRHKIGPWDLDHLHNVMAMPMALTTVNGKFKGGLWFSVPGPEQIARGELTAEFGFETEQEETEIVLEFTERDQARLSWDAMQTLELRRDERRLVPLLPLMQRHAPLYLDPGTAELDEYKSALRSTPQFQQMLERMKSEDAGQWTGSGFGSHIIFDIGCLVAWVTGDVEINDLVKTTLVNFCNRPTWSGRPDPLLIGGDNDRIIGHALYVAGMGWEYLKPLLNEDERRLVLGKAEEYLQKIYDFTLLQRSYMGCPNPTGHSLGTWHGVGVACMSFYHDLEIARRALPFFHGLFLDSLKLFPPGGKAKCATFHPFWLVRYLAAAQTFAGRVDEMGESVYLDNLGLALARYFLTPNAQELQRGVRTVEHRLITAFLCRFHPTPGIEAIYAAFVEAERRTAGDVRWGIFDLLYAPQSLPEPADFSPEPVVTPDIGEIVSTYRGKKAISTLIKGGMPAGAATSFHLHSHNRESHLSMGEIAIRVDDVPVLTDIIGYGLYSANKNTLCLEDGCGVAEGQYLNGDIAPEQCSFIRRCLLDERFIYADINLTYAIKPDLEVEYAQRTILQDRKTGVTVIGDFFRSRKPLRFSTHLHCSGSATRVNEDTFRLTGGQANLIAGSKGGSKGLSDDEAGEIFVQVLGASAPHAVRIEEAAWFPSYIYGININGGDSEESLKEARFPHYTRWRLEVEERIPQGDFLFALTPEPQMVEIQDGWVQLDENTHYRMNANGPIALPEGSCQAEAVVTDQQAKRILLLGARELDFAGAEMKFAIPVDIQLSYDNAGWQGNLYSPSEQPVLSTTNVNVGCFQRVGHQDVSAFAWRASFLKAS